MKSISLLAVISLAGGLLAFGSGCSRPTAAKSVESAHAAAASSVDRVTAGPPVRKTLSLYTSQPGRIEAFEETPLFPKVSGYVESVLVDIGDAVRKDQVVIKLWVPEMQDERRQKEALVAQAEAEVKQAESSVQAAEAAAGTAQARVGQAEAGIGRAEGEYQRWKSEHERIKQLAAGGSVTNKLADETLNQFRAADAARAEAAAGVESAKAGHTEAAAHVARAQADLVAAQARKHVAQTNLSQTQTMLGYAEIKAPFDGVVTQRGVDTKHYVQSASGPTSKPLLTVARTDQVRVFVDIPEMEAPLVDGGKTGDAAVVRVQSLRDREFERKVTRTSWSLDASNRSLRTEIDIPNEEGLLRPGMFATVTILLEQREGVLALPITAIVREGREAFCYCAQSGKIERKPVTLGLRSGDEVEIISGVGDGDTVVLARVDALQPGQAVEVIAAEK
ncbi:MAG: efflux RND transporter periplasmic adaptor subunit [Planctomycetaceae bacterium]